MNECLDDALFLKSSCYDAAFQRWNKFRKGYMFEPFKDC